MAPDGTRYKIQPEIRLNLYVLFVARFKQYEDALHYQQLQGNLSRKGFVPIRESIGNVPWRIFVVVFSWRSHNADAQTPLS
jgi:hypothetical protein